jgi:hypothetical protein
MGVQQERISTPLHDLLSPSRKPRSDEEFNAWLLQQATLRFGFGVEPVQALEPLAQVQSDGTAVQATMDDDDGDGTTITSSAPVPTNPYWEEAAALLLTLNKPREVRFSLDLEFGEDELVRRPMFLMFAREKRYELCWRYCWAVPDPDTLDVVAKWLGPKAIEIGAGTGYWAWQLSERGVDIVAYDAKPPDRVTTNYWCSPRTGRYGELVGELREVFFPLQKGGPSMLARQAHADRTLFLCWPPYNEDMASLCLEHYQGERLVYLGESAGGCTGDAQFFEALERDWALVETHRPMQWDGIHDWVQVYERRRRLQPSPAKARRVKSKQVRSETNKEREKAKEMQCGNPISGSC